MKESAELIIIIIIEKMFYDHNLFWPEFLLDRSNGGPSQAVSSNVQERKDSESSLIREYGALYAQARVVAMDALDALDQLGTADELKSKLLFSVVVVKTKPYLFSATCVALK